MNIVGILTAAFFIGGIVWAAILYKEHGLSFTTILGPAVVWGVAFLFLWIGNSFAAAPMIKQAQGLSNTTGQLIEGAAPALDVPQITVNGGNPGNPSSVFGGGDPTLSQNSGQPVVVVPTVQSAPNVGDVSWAGSVSPSYNDPMLAYQVSCFYNQNAQVTMFQNGYVPSGMTVSVIALNTFWQTADKEKWELRITYPHDQIPQQVYELDGVTARAIKAALGDDTVVGSASWPLVQQMWDGAKNVITNPVVCQYR